MNERDDCPDDFNLDLADADALHERERDEDDGQSYGHPRDERDERQQRMEAD